MGIMGKLSLTMIGQKAPPSSCEKEARSPSRARRSRIWVVATSRQRSPTTRQITPYLDDRMGKASMVVTTRVNERNVIPDVSERVNVVEQSMGKHH